MTTLLYSRWYINHMCQGKPEQLNPPTPMSTPNLYMVILLVSDTTDEQSGLNGHRKQAQYKESAIKGQFVLHQRPKHVSMRHMLHNIP